MYKFGEEISYDFDLLKADDYDSLQLFKCGNEILDDHIKSKVIKDGSIIDQDGLYFKFTDKSNGQIIAVVSLASSGILMDVTPFTQILPSIKIDVFAVHEDFQKKHYDIESLESPIPDEHYYFSDDLLGHTLGHCNTMIEKYALANYIVVYADKDAYRFYERNNFRNFENYMVKEHNMEVAKNIPMYLDLNN